MDKLAGVQEAYKQLLQQATAQFEQTVQEATMQMQNMLREAAKEAAPPKPVAEMRDGGLWLNEEAAKMLIETIDVVCKTVEAIAKEQQQQ